MINNWIFIFIYFSLFFLLQWVFPSVSVEGVMVFSLLGSSLWSFYKKKYTILASFLTGTLGFLSFPNGYLSFLAFFCLVPFMVGMRKETSYKRVFFYAFMTGLVTNIGTFYWLYDTLIQFTRLSSVTASVVFFVFIFVFLNWKPMAILLSFVWLKKNSKLSLLITYPMAVVLCDLVVYSPFYWKMGNTQYQNTYLIQIAEITGVLGITYLIVLVNTIVYKMYIEWKQEQVFHKKPVLYVGLVLAGVYLFGFLRVSALDNKNDAYKKLTVGLIQPNTRYLPYVDPVDKVYNRIRKLARKAYQAADLDILLLSESAVPLPHSNIARKEYRLFLDSLVEESKVPLFFQYHRRSAEKRYYNSATLLDEELRLAEPYDKVYLMPFGEYLPLDEQLPFLRKTLFRRVGRFLAGEEQKVFDFSWDGFFNTKIIPLICYEVLNPDFVRGFVQKGGEVIFNLTNDVWFGASKGSQLHFALSIFRAIENRIPIVRDTNSGISGFVNIYGQIDSDKQLGLNKRGFLVNVISIPKVKTFYGKYGDLFGYAVLVLLAILLMTEKFFKQRRF